MSASLGIEVNDRVIEELVVVQAAEVMLSQLHNIKLPSRWVHTPQVLHHSHQPKRRLAADTHFATKGMACNVVRVCHVGRRTMHGQDNCCRPD